MPVKGVCSWRKAYYVILVLLLGRTLFAAPGDLQLEVVTQTGDSGSGPEGLAFEQILTTGSGSEFPVSMDESGAVTFMATILVGEDELRGVFKGSLGGPPELLYLLGQNIPGLLQNGEPVVSDDLRAYSSSMDAPCSSCVRCFAHGRWSS
ncbi:hypothetical protein F7C95_01910 [Opitutia bacterium ISCC 51]|nr:hypothetical protein F7C95_01910 [Opitutae bacterium ISCC 51]QXD28756.1 hypothetical protein GA003_01900 [Opitutae bacterium ISCC 52]